MPDIAGRWLRVSTNAQDEASQEPDLDAWITQHGYTPGPTYRVHGKSAFHGEHEADLREAMADMKAGTINVLVVWKSDRIDRQEKLGALMREAQGYGGRIEFAKEPELNMLAGLGGRVMTVVKEWTAYDESKTKSDRVKAKQAGLRAAGSFMSGLVPYGYDIVKADGRKTLVPSTTAPVVARVFRMVAEGATLYDVVRWLETEGVPTARGNPVWREKTVGYMIANPAYRGVIRHNGATYMEVEPLVTAGEWLAANQRIKARGGNGSRGRRMTSLLRPVCGGCGWVMYRDRAWYRCKDGNVRRGCGNKIRVDVLEAEVLAEFRDHDEPAIETILIPGSDNYEELARLQLRIKDLDVMADDYEEQHATLLAELRRLRSVPATPGRTTNAYLGRTEGDLFREMTPAEQRAFMRLWTLTVYPEGSDEQNALVAALMGRRWHIRQ